MEGGITDYVIHGRSNRKEALMNICITECPCCDRPSLFWNEIKQVYECVACKGTYTEFSLLNTAKRISRLDQCPACRRMTCSREKKWIKTGNIVSTIEKLRCSYCNKEFTPEQAMVEEAEFRVHLAQKPRYSNGTGMSGYVDDGGWG